MWLSRCTGALLEELGYDLPRDAVAHLGDDYHLLEFFLRVCLDDKSRGREAARWIMGTLAELMTESHVGDIRRIPVRERALAGFCDMVRLREITPTDGKAVLREMWARGADPRDTAAFAACRYVTGSALEAVVSDVLAAHPDKAALARDGEAKVANWLVGQVMRATGGRADALAVRGLVLDRRLLD